MSYFHQGCFPWIDMWLQVSIEHIILSEANLHGYTPFVDLGKWTLICVLYKENIFQESNRNLLYLAISKLYACMLYWFKIDSLGLYLMYRYYTHTHSSHQLSTEWRSRNRSIKQESNRKLYLSISKLYACFADNLELIRLDYIWSINTKHSSHQLSTEWRSRKHQMVGYTIQQHQYPIRHR
jgi:hypothetical protein